MQYQLYELRSLEQCNNPRHRSGCPESCRIRPRIVVLPDDAPRDLVVEPIDRSVIRGWGDGTHGHIHIHPAWERLERIGMRTASRDRAIAWITRRLTGTAAGDAARLLIEQAEHAHTARHNQ